MYIKKFNNLEELLLSEEFKNKDLSYCDLSGIDLSNLPVETWEDFEFYYTNFTDTNIKFLPDKLKCYEYKNEYGIKKIHFKLEYCNFTNCDLSYLQTDDMVYVSIRGSNFTDTNLDIDLKPGFSVDDHLGYYQKAKDYSDVTFPKEYSKNKSIENISMVIDYKTIKNNPHIYFSSDTIFSVLRKEIPNTYFSDAIIQRLNILIKDMLEEDKKRGGCLQKFESIFFDNSSFSDFDKITFYSEKIIDKEFKEIDLSDIPSELINKLSFIRCSFEKIIFPSNYENVFNIEDKKCEYHHVYFPTLKPESWQTFHSNSLGFSGMTFKRNLYLELGRFCNAKCKFCRNQYLEPCKYNLGEIEKSLKKLDYKIDNLVVGGGEPTLLLDDLNKLRENLVRANAYFKWTVFTNASASLDDLISLASSFNLNISRHNINDDSNNKIFSTNCLSARDLKQLSNKAKKNITLCPTCFKGDGIDTVQKIEDYIEFAYDCNIKNILFQTLHKDLDSSCDMEVLPIEDEIFDEMIIKLQEQDFKISIPIYSTGDYKLIIAKKDGQNISFKKYITEEELEKEWYQACKRTFDLSMDPSGNVYQNWHQSSGKVLIK